MFKRNLLILCTLCLTIPSVDLWAQTSIGLTLNAPKTIQAGQLFKLRPIVTTSNSQPITLSFRNQTRTMPTNFTYLEAEALGGQSKQFTDASASNGKALKITKDYDAAIIAPFPQDGQSYNIWVRLKGANFCLKGCESIKGKASKEIQWNWGKPKAYKWIRYKPVNAQKVGKYFAIMKNTKSEGYLDAVLLTTDNSYKPARDLNSAPNVFTWQTLPTSVGTHTLTVIASQDEQQVTKTHQVQITAAPVKKKIVKTVAIHDAIAVDLSAIATPWNKQKTPYALNNALLDAVYDRPAFGLNLLKPTGIIALQCKQFMNLPQSVSIPVNKKAAGLAFIHTQYMQRDPFHAVAMYKVIYQDGSSESILLREEVNLAGSLRPAVASHAKLLNTIGHDGVDYHLFLMPWVNPHPRKLIKKIVFTNQINRENKEENTTLGFNMADATSQILLSLSIINTPASAIALREAINLNQTTSTNIAHATVDFSKPLGTISQGVFSTNETGTLSGRDTRFDAYKPLLDKMGCNNLRMHSGFRLHHIFPTSDTEGDFEKLDERITELKAGMPGRNIMMCFNRVPEYINPSLEADRKIFAKLCAKVVAHLNSKPETYVKYWEIYNEPFSKVIPEDRGHWKMYNLTAQAMKEIDSNIMIGGYAPCWPILSAMKDFYQYCHEQVDFLSWHKYPTGNTKTPTEHLMKGTKQFGIDVQNVRKIVQAITPGKKIEYALTEYHINFNWKPHDPRQATNVGSTWMASVIYHMLINDMDIAQSWHSRSGGTFGMMSKTLEVRPTGQLLYLLNRFVKGQRVQSRSDNPWVEVLGYAPDAKAKGLLVINKSDTPQTLTVELLNAQLPASDAFTANAKCHRLGPKGYTVEDQWLTNTSTVHILPYEVRLIVIP